MKTIRLKAAKTHYLVTAGLLAAAAVALAVLATNGPWSGVASAQQPESKRLLYTAKFTCVEDGSSGGRGAGPFEPAAYQTALNIHNFNGSDVQFRVKAVSAGHHGPPTQPPTAPIEVALASGHATDFTCGNIAGLFGDGEPVLDGFVSIDSPVELDVVAVYTARTVEVRMADRYTTFHEGFGTLANDPTRLPLPDAVSVDPVTGVPEETLGSSVQLSRTFLNPDFGSIGNGSVGLGLGVGAGVSIDVEYIQPRTVMVGGPGSLTIR